MENPFAGAYRQCDFLQATKKKSLRFITFAMNFHSSSSPITDVSPTALEFNNQKWWIGNVQIVLSIIQRHVRRLGEIKTIW